MISLSTFRTTLFLFLGFVCVPGYTFSQISIKNELKRDLLEGVKPSNSLMSTPSLMKQHDSKVISKENVLELHINRPSIEEYNPYKINPNAYTFLGITPLILDPRNTETVFEGGHFRQQPRGMKWGPSATFSLWEPKKVSEKDKNILKNVYDYDVDEK